MKNFENMGSSGQSEEFEPGIEDAETGVEGNIDDEMKQRNKERMADIAALEAEYEANQDLDALRDAMKIADEVEGDFGPRARRGSGSKFVIKAEQAEGYKDNVELQAEVSDVIEKYGFNPE